MIMGQNSTRVDIPHEPGEWMELRDELAPCHLEAAAEPVAKRNMEMRGVMLRTMGQENMGILMDSFRKGVSVQEAADQRGLTEGEPQGTSETSETSVDPPAAAAEVVTTPKAPDNSERRHFDMDVLAFKLVRDWSYTTSNRRGATVPAPVTLERVASLDLKTRSWLHDRAWVAAQVALSSMTEGNF